ncbi:hypothetical protein ACJW30_02G056400 [Castanea mollissima]
MQWWQWGDCGSDGLWVRCVVGWCRWPNQCWYDVWVATLVVVWCLSGCGLVFGWLNQWWFGVWVLGFFFSCFVGGCYLAGVCVVVGLWWLLLVCWRDKDRPKR